MSTPRLEWAFVDRLGKIEPEFGSHAGQLGTGHGVNWNVGHFRQAAGSDENQERAALNATSNYFSDAGYLGNPPFWRYCDKLRDFVFSSETNPSGTLQLDCVKKRHARSKRAYEQQRIDALAICVRENAPY